ncbi:MAG: SpoIIE family protein phosphatase [Gemmatimonadaceae bacterium]
MPDEDELTDSAPPDTPFNAAHILESISDAFFALDRAGRFTYLNGQAARLLARTRDGLLGANIWDAFPAAVGTASEREYSRAMAGESTSFEQYYPPLGKWFEARAYPSESGITVYFHDITERKRSEQALRDSEDRYRLLVDGAKDYAMILLDPEGLVTGWNIGAERILGWSEAEVLGQPADLIFTPDDCADGVPAREMRRAASEGKAMDLRWHLKKDGSRFWADGVMDGLRGEDGHLRGFTKVLRDATDRKALEAERAQIAEREHNIAQQLQAALTPSVPEHIPGMALAKYYKAALDEAGVGGDFYDVFPMDKSCTALVVGDLSGKGLAAASQVATARNMLRYALYRAHTLVGALQSLNSLLVEQQELLTGFATLFVGAYDKGDGMLTYVNCGQEPALIRRAAGGMVEQLVPTGPVLGLFEGATFEERTVALGPGDSLAVFTDGLTEVGRSRTEMLGVEGVADLLRGLTGVADPQEIVSRLMAGVDAHAGSGVRDDQCLLVGVVAAALP